MSEVTVIIPVYNSGRYLAGALASVRGQTFRAWECVCVDDGSSDSSAEIVAGFQAQDDRFRLVRQANAGPAAARNRGLTETRSPWFAFMDADDMLHPEALKLMYDVARREDADVVTASFARDENSMMADGTLQLWSDPVKRMIEDRSWRGEPWGRLMRTDLFADIRFTLRYHEDVGWLTAAMVKARREVVLGARLYYYRETPGSFSARPDYNAALPALWRFQASVCPALKPRLGEIAYSRWRKHSAEFTIGELLQLRDEGVVSFSRLNWRKRLRMWCASKRR